MTKTERTDDLIHRWMNDNELTGAEMRELINGLIDLRRAPARAHLSLATTEELFEELIRRTWNAKMSARVVQVLTTDELRDELVRRHYNVQTVTARPAENRVEPAPPVELDPTLGVLVERQTDVLYEMLASVGRIEEALTADKRPGECDHEWEPQSGGRTRCRKCLQWHHALCDHEWRTEFSYGSVVLDPFAPLPKRCIKCGVRIVPLT